MKSTSQSFASACARLLLGVALACFGLTDHLPAQQRDALNPTRDGAASVAANEDDTEVVQLNVFTVEGTKGQSYGASNLASATRLNTPAENVPQSISVINSNLLRDIGAYQFDQVMRYTPGVTPRHVSLIMGTMFSFCYVVSAFAPNLVAFLRDKTGSFVPGFVVLTVLSWVIFVAGFLLPETGPNARKPASAAA